MDKKIESKSSKDKLIIGTPDSLLMLIGEMLVYDFGRMDSAANRYEEMVSRFPDSKFTPRAMYALTFYSEDSLVWRERFNEKYPNPKFLIEKEAAVTNRLIAQKREQILDNFNENPLLTRDELESFFHNYNDPDALYYSAYISDYFLNDIEKSKNIYKMFVDSFPKHDQYRSAKSRFEEIEQSILDTVIKDEDTISIAIKDSMNFIQDSIKNVYQNFDSLFNEKDSSNKFELLNGLDIQLDSNFIKKIRPNSSKELRQ